MTGHCRGLFIHFLIVLGCHLCARLSPRLTLPSLLRLRCGPLPLPSPHMATPSELSSLSALSSLAHLCRRLPFTWTQCVSESLHPRVRLMPENSQVHRWAYLPVSLAVRLHFCSAFCHSNLIHGVTVLQGWHSGGARDTFDSIFLYHPFIYESLDSVPFKPFP